MVPLQPEKFLDAVQKDINSEQTNKIEQYISLITQCSSTHRKSMAPLQLQNSSQTYKMKLHKDNIFFNETMLLQS